MDIIDPLKYTNKNNNEQYMYLLDIVEKLMKLYMYNNIISIIIFKLLENKINLKLTQNKGNIILRDKKIIMIVAYSQ